jgi:hypothetical protein
VKEGGREGGRREAVKEKGKRGWFHKKMRAGETVRERAPNGSERYFFHWVVILLHHAHAHDARVHTALCTCSVRPPGPFAGKKWLTKGLI